MYYYKARIYSPTLGRFLQPDPIGYEDGMNLYAYVRNDPVNFVDPSGLMTCQEEAMIAASVGEIVVCGPSRGSSGWGNFGSLLRSGGGSFGGGGGGSGGSGAGQTPKTPEPQKAQPKEKSNLDKLKACAAAQYGFGNGDTPTGLDFGKMVSELGALPIPKALVGVPVIGNSSTVTNAVSLIPHKLGIRVNTGMQILGSGRLFGVLGRANAVIGGAMLAWDAASIAICTAKD